MSKSKQYTAEQFIKAVKGSGGVISSIAARVGCDWKTAKTYIENYSTIKDAYDAELETVLDVAESVIMGNIQAAQKEQKVFNYNKQVDSADAKWFLTKKGKRRGYGSEDEQGVLGGGDVVIYIPDNGRK